MNILILGASGSGVTTLGKYLSKKINVNYFDSDYYFWEESDPPFTVRRDDLLRNSLLIKELNSNENWILGGSIIKWELDIHFDLIVFLWIPEVIRIDRLKKRELERYGDIIYTDKLRNNLYNEFIEWSRGYDNNTARGRTLKAQTDWILSKKSSVLELKGDMTVEERASKIIDILSEKKIF